MNDFFAKVKTVLLNHVMSSPQIIPQKGFVDETNVLMFIPKTQQLMDICEKVFTSTMDIPKIEHTRVGKAKFNTQYIKKVLSLIKTESFTLLSSENYPIQIITDDFEFVVAPRWSGEFD